MKKYKFNKLTEKELNVLYEVLKGKTNAEISEKLFVTLHTVKSHMQNLFFKTNTKHRTELISKIFGKSMGVNLESEAFYNMIKHKIK